MRCQYYNQVVTSLPLKGYCTRFFKILLGTLGLQWEMGRETIFGKTCGEGTDLWVPSFQDYLK